MKRELIEVLVETPYTTMGILGGIITPMLPAVAISARVKLLLYPFCSIVGMTIEPIAATVAGPDPDTAAKNIQSTTVTVARPPVNLPRNTLHTLRRRFDTPPAPISSPARINRGIAISGKESALVTSC